MKENKVMIISHLIASTVVGCMIIISLFVNISKKYKIINELTEEINKYRLEEMNEQRR